MARPRQRREVRTTILDWLDKHASLLAAIYCWFYNRLTGARCFAQDCGRLLLLHTPRQRRRCIDTPLAIAITDRGWLYGHGVDPDSVVPVSHADIA